MALPSAVKQPLLRKLHVHIRRESGADFAAPAPAAASANANANATTPGLKMIADHDLSCHYVAGLLGATSGRARSGPRSGMARLWTHGGVCGGKRRWGEGTSSAPLEYGNAEKVRYPQQKNAQKPSAATHVPRPKRHGPRRPAPSGTRPTRSIDYHRRLKTQRCTIPS
ncbi:hypothetical protein DFH09DRAFT_1136606 [Mycena vulgaris]|nr:hypothetical protein DFH09DRAFT_1136606 [Mycena vulgaris]